ANLPVQIKFLPPDVVADERVKLFFDMPAEQYPIFCELLKFGIFGSVKLSEPGLNVDVPVHLQFEQMTTNMLRIEQAAAPAPAQAGDPPGPATLSVTNLLQFPVQLPSLTLNLLDTGEASKMILDAETMQLVPSARELPAQSNGAAATASFPFQAQR